MKDVLWLMKNFFKIMFKNKRRTLITTGLPILGILFSVLIYGGGNTAELNVGLINKENTPVAKGTVSFIRDLDHVNVKNVKASEVEQAVSEGDLDAAITIGDGFTESVKAGHPDHVAITSLKGRAVTGFVKAYLNQYLDSLGTLGKASHGDNDTFDNLYSNFSGSDFDVKPVSLKDNTKNSYMTYQTIGFLMMFMMFAAINLSGAISLEKEQRTYFRMLSAPISARKFVLSNVLANLIIMIGQIVVTLFFMVAVFRISLNMPLWEMFSTMVLFALVAVGLSLAIIAFSTSNGTTNALQNLIVTPTCLLSGCFFPISVMPDTLKHIAHFLPQTWLLDTIQKLQQGQSFGGIYLNILILLAFASVFFLLAVFKFSRNDSVQTYL
ncbi:ABC transporter permease [Halobacillus rhizosphaerae]|uniref:ABC transporter permease n=1 Tax=Halobacillus rhizosphaerae TaxID=3064889 RepID=UPI00398AB22C